MDRPPSPTAAMFVRWVVSLGTALAVAACSRTPPDETSWRSEREVRGDTTVVTTLGGSVWSSARLVPELRIGVLEGPEEYIFGRILALTPDGTGGVYVFDGLVPALRHYDADGRYVETFGGEGAGPGEYRDAVLGMALRSDGRLVLRDPRNSRLNVYAADGSASDHWRVESGLFAPHALLVDTADHMYLKILLEPPQRNRPWKIGLLHLDATGTIVDTIPPPTIPGEPTDGGGPLIPHKHWARSPFGYTAVGLSNDYTFEVRHPDGRVTRVVRAHTPVEVLPEERAEMEAQNEWMRTYQGEFLTTLPPAVPSSKPAYSDMLAGNDGRIWIRRHVKAVRSREGKEGTPESPPRSSWVEPVVYDVFEPDGTYLGEVRLPDRTRISWIGRDHVWAVQTGEMDEAYVVRFRLVTE